MYFLCLSDRRDPAVNPASLKVPGAPLSLLLIYKYRIHGNCVSQPKLETSLSDSGPGDRAGLGDTVMV